MSFKPVAEGLQAPSVSQSVPNFFAVKPTPSLSLPAAAQNARREPAPKVERARPCSPASPKPYYVYLLVGVHPSYASAKEALQRLGVSKKLPVRFERNVNGLGKCKAWMAVSSAFCTRSAAEVASRQIAQFAGQGAVTIFRAHSN